MSTTWFKFPTSYFAEARTIRLRRVIGEAAYWVPVRLWAFAASQDGSGNLKDYEAIELAEALHYQGDAAQLLAALTPDFIDRRGRIVGWNELFLLAASRKASSQKAAKARWDRRPTQEQTRPEKRIGEESECERRGDRHAVRDAVRDAFPASETHTPTTGEVFSISDQTCSEVQKEFGMGKESVIEAVRVFVENKTPYVAKDGPLSEVGFRGWLRTSAAGREITKRSRPQRVESYDKI